MFESFWNIFGYDTTDLYTSESRDSGDETYATQDDNAAWFDLYGLPRAPSCTEDNDESFYGEEQSESCYDEDEWTLPAPPSLVY
jgi:hypothetical protein